MNLPGSGGKIHWYALLNFETLLSWKQHNCSTTYYENLEKLSKRQGDLAGTSGAREVTLGPQLICELTIRKNS